MGQTRSLQFPHRYRRIHLPRLAHPRRALRAAPAATRTQQRHRAVGRRRHDCPAIHHPEASPAGQRAFRRGRRAHLRLHPDLGPPRHPHRRHPRVSPLPGDAAHARLPARTGDHLTPRQCGGPAPRLRTHLQQRPADPARPTAPRLKDLLRAPRLRQRRRDESQPARARPRIRHGAAPRHDHHHPHRRPPPDGRPPRADRQTGRLLAHPPHHRRDR
ncbi:MAG: hypothetical protein BWX86_02767 [Verrucomicrobia bacterium ADurb.Bin122]|nr:MAG: hypothetical protein BWX86_02767 [Verrucomicrobia bacterium ADurb.Bin122]